MVDVVCLACLIVLLVLDTWAYCIAKWPDRASHWGYKWFPGGFLALWRFGRHHDI